ncbi:MAG: hypothetical protein AAFV36_04775 [Myxococcota bacterium]
MAVLAAFLRAASHRGPKTLLHPANHSSRSQWSLNIGGLVFSVRAEVPERASIDHHSVFQDPFVGPYRPGIPVECRYGRVVKPRQAPHFHAGRAWSGYREPNALRFVLQGGLPRPSCELTYRVYERCSTFELVTDRDLELDAQNETKSCLPPFRYPLDSLATKLLLRDGVVLHASAVVIDGRAYVFVGPSGAGKTTLARLLRDDHTVLSDERIIVREFSDGYRVYGTPWPSDLRAAENSSAPLGAIFLLGHQPAERDLHRVEAVEPSDAQDALVPCASVTFFDDALMQVQLRFLQQLARNAIVRRLYFSIDPGVRDAIISV